MKTNSLSNTDTLRRNNFTFNFKHILHLAPNLQ